MAYTEKFVTSTGTEAWATNSEGNPSSLAEALNLCLAGERANIKSDAGYSSSGDSFDNAGSLSQAVCFRGYNSTIGDLEANGWNADGSLNTTGFPVITLTGSLTIASSINLLIIQNLVLQATSLQSELINGGGADKITLIECKLTNSTNHPSAACYRVDND